MTDKLGAVDPTSFAAITGGTTGLDGQLRGVERAPELSLISHYWRIIKRRKWTVIGSIAIALVLGLVLSMLATRQYTATSTVEIQRENAKILNVEGVRSQVTSADQEFYQTQYGLLKSRRLAELVVANLKLTRDPQFREAFGLAPLGGSSLSTKIVGSAAGTSQEITQARNILLGNVTISPVRLSRLIDISFTSPDPALSAKIANAWSEAFIQSNIQRGFDETGFARKFLEDRLESTRQKLEESERLSVDYASRQRIVAVETQGPNGTSTDSKSLNEEGLSALTAELNKAIADRLAAEAAYKAGFKSGSGDIGIGGASSALRQRRAEVSAEYQKMLVQFEPGYPAAQALKEQLNQLDRSIATEERYVKSSASKELGAGYTAAVDRENRLRTAVGEQTQRLLAEKRAGIQYNIYKREVDTNRQLYDALLQRYKEIGVAGGANRTNVSIVDKADIPASPSKPNIPFNLFLALIAGAIIGFALTVIWEQIDVAVSDPTDVQRSLGLPVLGVIPQGEDEEQDIATALVDRKSAISEAYLSLRTTIAFTTTHGIPATIAVTSTRPGEGKSTTAYALARLIASSGKKTLLVDCDMRSPSVHLLVAGANKVGLSNALSGQDDLGSMFLQGPEEGLSILTAGPIPPSAAELLASDRLPWLLNELTTRYGFDHVVLDSPPVIGLADALIVSSRAEATIYVVEAHATRVNQVLSALQRLSSVDSHIIGVALTKFRSEKSAFTYDYGYGYGSERRKTA